MAGTLGDPLWRRFHGWGARRVFGYPGDGINGLIGALDRTEDAIEFVQVRHVELTAFMAGAHAKYTGGVGVRLATSGIGAIQPLNGFHDAHPDHLPVLAIAGQRARVVPGGHHRREVESEAFSRTSPAHPCGGRACSTGCAARWVAPRASPSAACSRRCAR
jgi:pyruvate dehydrogenase (quinone)